MVFGNIGQAEDINDEIKYFCCRILEILIKKSGQMRVGHFGSMFLIYLKTSN